MKFMKFAFALHLILSFIQLSNSSILQEEDVHQNHFHFLTNINEAREKKTITWHIIFLIIMLIIILALLFVDMFVWDFLDQLCIATIEKIRNNKRREQSPIIKSNSFKPENGL